MSVDAFRRAGERRPPLRAPYNFVPLNRTVLPSPLGTDPDLGTPLANGLSGEITVEWRVETPLLVGGIDNNAPFCIDGGDPSVPGSGFALPGASLRGMIRSVLEIMSYAHLEPVADQRFGVRDFEAVSWQRIMVDDRRLAGKRKTVVKSNGDQAQIRVPFSGWLEATFDGDSFASGRITECDYVEIPIVDLCRVLGLVKDQWDRLSLAARHAEISGSGLQGEIDLGQVSPSLGGRRGTLVVAGNALRDRGQTTKKATETAFLAPVGPVWPIGREAFGAFDSIQVKDAGTHTGPPEANWSYWRRCLERGERVPVFYRGDPAKAAAGVPAANEFVMALTRLMRVPHRRTIHQVRGRDQPPLSATRLDLVQALFGHVPPDGATAVPGGKGRQRAWRSRVRFGMATLADGCIATPLGRRAAVTMRPRASYWPFYLRPGPESGNARLAHPVDWSSDGARLAGRKRYPARDRAEREMPAAPADNRDQQNELIFLDASCEEPLVFRSAVRFHNVLPEELGGLVWAIGFGSHRGPQKRRLRHMLGRAKAFGYGQVEAAICEPVRLVANGAGEPPTLAECATAFEEWLGSALRDGRPFTGRPEIASLLAICDADHGSALREVLAFPEFGRTGQPAQRILDAYSEIRRRAGNKPATKYPHWRGGQTIGRDPLADDFLFLPDYPLPDEEEDA